MKNILIPNLFILGAAKCGTTTLHDYLSQLSGVCMSLPKEPFFFEAYYEKGMDFYKRHYFSHWNGEPFIGEARHRNLIQPYVPERIYKTNPKAKLIIIVRNPVDRAFSHWYHNYSRHSEKLSFKEAIKADLERIEKGLKCDTEGEIKEHIKRLPIPSKGKVKGLGLYRTYIDTGYYYQQIQRYLLYFNANDIKVILFEDLVSKPYEVIGEVTDFIDLSCCAEKVIISNKNRHLEFPSDLVPFSLRLINVINKVKYFLRRDLNYKEIKPYNHFRTKNIKTLSWLTHHYREHNDELANFINKDLTNWNQIQEI